MKQGHFAVVFFIVLMLFSQRIYVEQEKYRQVEEEKKALESGLLVAVEKTIGKMRFIVKEEEEVKLKMLEETFFDSWFLQLGISENLEQQELAKMYVPMIAWLEEKGGYFYYTEVVENEGVCILEQRWSQFVPYSLVDDSVRREEVILYLEQQASYIITEHNRIAQQYGIEYRFHVPSFLGTGAKDTDFPILIVVFQGWPLEAAGEILYENCIDANAYLKETEQYLVELSGEEKERYVYLHREKCEYILMPENVLQERFTEKEAQEMYGAMPCPYCFEEFVTSCFVPR